MAFVWFGTGPAGAYTGRAATTDGGGGAGGEEDSVAVALKTFGVVAVVLIGALVYLSVFVLGFYALFYLALGGTFVMLGIMVVLSAGGQPLRRADKAPAADAGATGRQAA